MFCKNSEFDGLLRVLIMGIASIINTFFGGADSLFKTLIAFMVLDYISGLCYAISAKTVSSKIGAKGISRKIGILIIITLAVFLENNILHTTSLRYAVILFYISNEGISIMENMAKLGVPLPKRIVDILNNLTGENNKQS